MIAPLLGGLCEPCVLEEFKETGSETEPFCETPKESLEGRWGSGLCYQASEHEASEACQSSASVGHQIYRQCFQGSEHVTKIVSSSLCEPLLLSFIG